MCNLSVTTRHERVKNCTYYIFHDRINIEDFDSNLLKTDKISHKNMSIYYIGYITTTKIDDYENIYNVNPLYLIIGKVDEFVEEQNRSKYLNFDSTDENKEVLKNTELWDGIENEVEDINGAKTGQYGEDFMKIKFNSFDSLDLFSKKMVNWIHTFI